jgi:UDP-N-acetylglucosamine 4,6-dehydratase/5-epimerase
MLKGKKILITGGTGSLGQALTKRLLDLDVDTVRIFSRNENNQFKMQSELKDDRLRYFVGDVRDLPRLTRAVEDIDIVYHAAALKHVPIIEYNPFEAIKTNVLGSQNVIDACLHENVETSICIGTDKAVSPFNTYGATKLLMEKLFVTAGNYLNKEKHRTKFIALRYGNVFGSSGSVVLHFMNQIQNNQKLSITDPAMTRFNITMNTALDFILESTILGQGSEIFVPKLKAYKITDLVDVMTELKKNVNQEIIGIRSGEKLHEILISNNELRNTWELGNKYVIFNNKNDEENLKNSHAELKKIDQTSEYSSDSAVKLSKSELRELIKNYI